MRVFDPESTHGGLGRWCPSTGRFVSAVERVQAALLEVVGDLHGRVAATDLAGALKATATRLRHRQSSLSTTPAGVWVERLWEEGLPTGEDALVRYIALGAVPPPASTTQEPAARRP